MNIGRNDPCPCGSGLKYKKCCIYNNGDSSTPKQPDYITNEAEFLRRIDGADAKLAKGLMPPHARPLHAFNLLAPGYVGHLMGYKVDPNDYPEFVGPNLLRHINRWYERRYGDRMLMPSDRGKVPILLREQIFLMRIPLAFGHPKISILPLIEGLTEDMIVSFSQSERRVIRSLFEEGYELIYEIEDLTEWIRYKGKVALNEYTVNMIRSAVEDRDTAVRCLNGQLDTNGSCFHAQQHAEKMMKGYLLSQDVCTVDELRRKPYGHNLKRILSQCIEISPAVDAVAEDIALLSSFSMDIRYAGPRMDHETAVAVYWAALRVGGLMACHISGMERRYGFKSRYKTFTSTDPAKGFDTVLTAGKYYYNPNLGISYLCESILESKATMFLVESDDSGSYMQVRFVQSTEFASQYIEIIDGREIKRLTMIYNKTTQEQGRSIDPFKKNYG